MDPESIKPQHHKILPQKTSEPRGNPQKCWAVGSRGYRLHRSHLVSQVVPSLGGTQRIPAGEGMLTSPTPSAPIPGRASPLSRSEGVAIRPV